MAQLLQATQCDRCGGGGVGFRRNLNMSYLGYPRIHLDSRICESNIAAKKKVETTKDGGADCSR